MKKNSLTLTCWLLAMMMVGTSATYAKRRKKSKKAPVKVELTEAGKALEAQYTAKLQALKTQITSALPQIDPAKKSAFFKLKNVEKAAKSELDAAKKNMGQIGRAKGLVGHAKNKWIGGAKKGIATTQAKLKAAKTDAERQAAQKELEKWQKNLKAGENALKERQAMLDKALAEEPQLKKAVEAAKAKLDKAQADSLNALKALGIEGFLESDDMDAKLAEYVVLSEATPNGLAAFAQQGETQKKLVDALLANPKLMMQMAVADGASGGNYGQAMAIYAAIQQKSAKAGSGVLQRLALAISLEHAIPLSQRNPKAKADAPQTVDPVGRYLQFEKAYLAGELDPAFKDFSVWDYRMVVDGSEPDETLVWGREMLRNYRPDHTTTSDYRWRYVAAVRTDVRYGSQDNKHDKPELQFFQNILMNGGVCGRRAFFGRFILRAFGIPTTARPQRGHAALAHWTPKGWVVCLGGGWGAGYTKGRYNKDLDFLANTQAREQRKDYLQVKRAQWVGSVVGEKPVYGFLSGEPGFWYGVSLFKQRQIIQEAKAVALAAVGTDIGEANESKVKEKVVAATITAADKKVTVDGKGVITIPAAACSNPKNSTRKIKFLKSYADGMQLNYERNGGGEPFEYTFDAPMAGKYALVARVATPSWKQRLHVSANGSKTSVDLALPHTVGMWETTQPVAVTLKAGKNVLTFTHSSEGHSKGFAIKEFTLTPVK